MKKNNQKKVILEAAIRIISDNGLAAVTHRKIAKAASVTLSRTTYYFSTKQQIVDDAASVILSGYITLLDNFAVSLKQKNRKLKTVEEFCDRLISNAAGQHRQKALAWCEIMLDYARKSEGSDIARHWFSELSHCWRRVANALSVNIDDIDLQILIDTTLGMQFVVLALGLTADDVIKISVSDDPTERFNQILSKRNEIDDGVSKFGNKGLSSINNIINATITVITEQGPSYVTYKNVAQYASMSLSAPAYYFNSISELLRVAERRIFFEAKDRYRRAIGSTPSPLQTIDNLADLSAAVFIREATEFRLPSIAHYQIWLEAARSEPLRPEIAEAVVDQIRAWRRRFEMLGPCSNRHALLAQSHFVGRLVRVMACGARIGDLTDFRKEFLRGFQIRWGAK